MSKKTLEEIEVVCTDCGFPVLKTELYKIGPKKGQTKKLTLARKYPKTEEEALGQGWTDSGFGLFCPECSAKSQEEAEKDKAEEAESGCGTGGMASLLAGVPITDEQVLGEQPQLVFGAKNRFENHGDGTGTLYFQSGEEMEAALLNPEWRQRAHETYCAPNKITVLNLAVWTPERDCSHEYEKQTGGHRNDCPTCHEEESK